METQIWLRSHSKGLGVKNVNSDLLIFYPVIFHCLVLLGGISVFILV